MPEAIHKDIGNQNPSAGMGSGSGGLFNTPGLGAGRKRWKRGRVVTKGGTGSGNFAHTSVPGKRGGSIGGTRVSSRLPKRKLQPRGYRIRTGTHRVGSGPKSMRKPVAVRPSPIYAVSGNSGSASSMRGRKFAMRRKYVPKELKPSFVIKESAGNLRWTMVSSNSFKDREKEIVSYKALNDSCDYADRTGDYGTLRWWHMGGRRSGLDLGLCDFNCMVGKFLVESGTFFTDEIGEAVRKEAPSLEGSLAFFPLEVNAADSMYTGLYKFERSLLPVGKAANGVTSIFVSKERDNMATHQEKWDEFVTRLFDGDEVKAKEYVAVVQSTQQRLEEMGIVSKEKVGAEKVKLDDDSTPDPALKKLEKAKTKAKDEPEAEDDKGEEGAEKKVKYKVKVKEMELTEQEPPSEDVPMCVGDMTLPEFEQVMAGVVTGILTGVTARIKEYTATVQKEVTVPGGVQGLAQRLATLEGDAPLAAKTGFRASTSPQTVNTDPRLKEASQPASTGDEMTDKMLNDIFKQGVLPR